ncbi:MAG: recombinase family protein [Thermotoga sp.]|nr:recombinase family protein [Thermotoga sp.]
MAKYLNEKGYKTKKGKHFTHMQVKRILERGTSERLLCDGVSRLPNQEYR